MVAFPPRRREPKDRGAAFRRQHERWLTLALSSGLPAFRIPLRRVDRGGFSRLMAREGGRRRAQEWWLLALQRIGLEE